MMLLDWRRVYEADSRITRERQTDGRTDRQMDTTFYTEGKVGFKKSTTTTRKTTTTTTALY